MDDPSIRHALQLAARLERISADSTWAHQASGLRVSLLRCLEQIEAGRGSLRKRMAQMEGLMEKGYQVLENAAREIEGPK